MGESDKSEVVAGMSMWSNKGEAVMGTEWVKVTRAKLWWEKSA
ncbi:hypothetical protein [Paenibacillus sp. GM2]|nr:hypothetical protein [Paenibacillus sp. GM2]